MGKKQKQKIILPPELPPEISEDEIEISDDDLQFVSENCDYAGFVSRLDTHSITKFVAFNSLLAFTYKLEHESSYFSFMGCLMNS